MQLNHENQRLGNLLPKKKGFFSFASIIDAVADSYLLPAMYSGSVPLMK